MALTISVSVTCVLYKKSIRNRMAAMEIPAELALASRLMFNVSWLPRRLPRFNYASITHYLEHRITTRFVVRRKYLDLELQ